MNSCNPKGRGAGLNPANRFEPIEWVRDLDYDPSEDPDPRTLLLNDTTTTVINSNNSPDVGFEKSVNPYRGCEHGCIYCFARPTHEYLGFSAGLDFETKILVKQDAPTLLRRELSSRKWTPETIVMSGVTDCYQPIEKKLRITRGCLEVLAEFRNPVGIITKNFLVTRDIDLLGSLAGHGASMVNVSVTTLDASLTPKLEPRASQPAMRLEAIRQLSAAGIPVNVMVAPVIPGLTDHEMPEILSAARKAGARTAGYVPLRLPFAVKDLFQDWLERHFPERKEKVLGRIRSLRGGKLNDGNFGSRMKGEGIWAEHFSRLFEVSKRKAGFKEGERIELSSAAFRKTDRDQLPLF